VAGLTQLSSRVTELLPELSAAADAVADADAAVAGLRVEQARLRALLPPRGWSGRGASQWCPPADWRPSSAGVARPTTGCASPELASPMPRRRTTRRARCWPPRRTAVHRRGP